MRCLLYILIWSSFTATDATATDAAAINCDHATLQAAVNAANPGDTITCGAGSWTWSSTLDVAKSVIIIGAGQGITTFTNNAATVFHVSNTGESFVRLSGFTINSADKQVPVDLVGPIYKIRIDHITFNKGDSIHANYPGTGATGPVYGVIDHSTFRNMGRPYFATDVRGGESIWGQTAWNEFSANPATFPGSDKMMYFEDDQFVWDGSLTNPNAQGALYGQYGGKAVIRYSTLTGFCTYVDAHGDGPDYGTIYYELYNNTFTEDHTHLGCSGAADIVGMRGGQLVAHDNTFIGVTKPFGMTVYSSTDLLLSHRVQNTYYWSNSWNGDANQADLTYVFNTSYNPGGSTCSTTGCIRLNYEYFLHAVQPAKPITPTALTPIRTLLPAVACRHRRLC
jgi:hypothetical protein